MSKSRPTKLLLEDIADSIFKIQKYVKDFDYLAFSESSLIIDACVRNLEIIGEACKLLPQELKDQNSQIPWKDITATRNKLIHDYFGVNLDILWAIIQDELPQLIEEIKQLIKTQN